MKWDLSEHAIFVVTVFFLSGIIAMAALLGILGREALSQSEATWSALLGGLLGVIMSYKLVDPVDRFLIRLGC